MTESQSSNQDLTLEELIAKFDVVSAYVLQLPARGEHDWALKAARENATQTLLAEGLSPAEGNAPQAARWYQVALDNYELAIATGAFRYREPKI